jgi:uncharacterized damage-inducible protein DinB
MDLQYPIGKFQRPGRLSTEQRNELIQNLGALPGLLLQALEGLDEEQQDTPYREGGWTVRQVVHHLADSHMNAYIRMKLALTEKEPTIKTYNEDAWAKLEDASEAPIDSSLVLLTTLHDRWVRTLRAMSPEEFERTFRHPETGTVDLDQQLALYDWHGKHHLAHITSLRDRMGWNNG